MKRIVQECATSLEKPDIEVELFKVCRVVVTVLCPEPGVAISFATISSWKHIIFVLCVSHAWDIVMN